MLEEFKEFIQRGNVFEMAVGIILGTAVGNIVNSLVNDVLMPFLGIFLGGVDFTSLAIRVGGATLYYGKFLQNAVNFVIIAACIFVIMKAFNKLLEDDKKEEVKEEEPKVSEDVALLTEIRDLLKKKK